MRSLPTPVNRLWLLIFFLFMLLSGCTSSNEPPFHIRKLSFSETPVVGKVTDLVIEVENDQNWDATHVVISIYVPNGVHLVKNDALKEVPDHERNYHMKSTLKAKSQATYRIPICVTKEGDQQISVGAHEVLSENSVLGERETIHVINVGRRHRVVSGRDYRITRLPRYYQTPTPIPVILPADCTDTK